MANIKQIKVGTTTYDIVDAGAARSSHTHSNYLTSHQDLSNYVTLNTDQTITGKKTFGPMKMSGRWANSGDDEGLIIGKANNGYAGVCLGDPSGVRSVFYLNSTDNAIWRYCSTSGGSAYDLAHPGKSGTIATTGDLSRSFSGTTTGNSGTAVAAVTEVAGDGTATALTGVKVSSSSSAAPGGHTHTYTAPAAHTHTYDKATSVSVSFTSGTAPSLGSATTRYLSASFSGSAVTSGGASTTTTSSSGTGATGAPNSGGTTTLSYISASYNSTTKTLTLTSNSANVATSGHTHNGPSHTHTLSHTHSVTASGSITLTENESTATGRIQYVKSQGSFSAGTTPPSSASASITHTSTASGSAGSGTANQTTGANSGTNFNAATGVSSDGTATVLTGVKASGTANCAPAEHTHEYSGVTN